MSARARLSTGSGRFADAFRWLARNASTYCFIQPFDIKGGHGKGYMPERWDKGGTGIKPDSFIAKNWRDYVYNVEQLGVF